MEYEIKNHIFELYKKVEVPELDYGCQIINSGQSVPCEDNPEYKCESCCYNLGDDNYPKFTEAKQLALVKLIGRKCSFSLSSNYIRSGTLDGFWFNAGSEINDNYDEGFAQGIAKIAIDALNISMIECEEVRNILSEVDK